MEPDSRKRHVTYGLEINQAVSIIEFIVERFVEYQEAISGLSLKYGQ